MGRMSKKEKERLELERLEQERLAKLKEEKERKKKVLIIIIFFIVMLGVLPALAMGLFDSLNNQIIEITGGTRISAPVITGGSKEWQKEALVKIKEDADSNRDITHYEYCVSQSKNTDNCDWKVTKTKNAVVSKTGIYYVTFRAVTDNLKKGKLSNQEIVYIDNNNPTISNVNIKKITDNSIAVETVAKDNESGISNYLYSLDGKNYTDGKLNYTYTGLNANQKYRVYVKVVDKLGNEIVTSMEVTTAKTDEPKKEEKTADDKKSEEKVEPTPTDEPIPSPEPTATPEPTPEEPEIEWDMPTIDLVDVPAVFTYADKYDLPSHYDFGNDTGTVRCMTDGYVYTDTSLIFPGTHTIVCTATSSHGKTAEVEKDIEVELQEGEDEVLDGWVKLNLYYPINSTDWEWRLGTDNSVRTGYNDDGWQPYTGPILVKLEDISNVYIRYKMAGKVYIIPPAGKITVDIDPEYYSVRDGQTTKIEINYDSSATVKQYKVNGGSWQDYTGPIEVGPSTLVEAQATKEEKVYNNLGEYQYSKTIVGNDSVYISLYTDAATPIPGTTPLPTPHPIYSPTPTPTSTPTPGSVYVPVVPTPMPTPSYYLGGPIITSDPKTTLVDEVTVTITPQYPASKIYYSESYGDYKEYTGPFKVRKNETIRAYYVRQSDSKVSDTEYYYVGNIDPHDLPNVIIYTNPSYYLSSTVNTVTVTIGGSNYNTLEYSFDGIIYQPYTGAFDVTQSTTVYAKGTNSNGSRVEKLTINTLNPPVPRDNLTVTVLATPDASSVVGLINEVEVEIVYDGRATNKYYKIGYFGEWKTYTGPFKLNKNATIYAYCTSDNGSGDDKLSIGYLTTGISDPIIKADTSSPQTNIKVEIDYDKNATITRYKIDNGDYVDYTGPFYVTENTTVTALNRDVLGNEGISTRTISNVIASPPVYQLTDKGAYFIIKLNYPDVSDTNSREYKWKEDGKWKQYDNDKGILLIKPEYQNLIAANAGGVLVKDENNNDVVFTDNYYIVDVPLSEVFENIFMRWDNEKPDAPTIEIIPDKTPTRKVDVFISYGPTIAKKYYKLVKPDGTDTGWLEYTEPFKVDVNNTVIYAKGINIIDIESNLATLKVTNIDEILPTITLKGDFTTPKQKVPVTVSAKDDLELDIIKYVEGKQNEDYFATDGTVVPNNSVVTLTKDDTYYTFYAKDKVGNEVVKTVYIDNIDLTAPSINITDLTQGFGTQSEINIDYGDSITKEYRIGSTGNFVPYPANGNLVLNSSDVYDKADNGVLTIYAKGTDSAGNYDIVSDSIYTLDVDMPNAPIITANAGYPILTSYGVKYDDALTVTYDNRNDIINYIDIGNGEGWKVYTGVEHVLKSTVKAKSVKPSTGLETPVVTVEVSQPTDAVGLKAYDDDPNTYALGNYGTKVRIYLDSDLIGRKVHVRTTAGNNNNVVRVVAPGLPNTFSKGAADLNENILIEPGSKYIEIESKGYMTNIYDISVADVPQFNENKVYPKLDFYGYHEGYDDIEIEYFTTAVERYYKIDNGDWEVYQNKPIRLLPKQKIYAKSVNKYGEETKTNEYQFKPVDYIEYYTNGNKAYDDDKDTYATITTGTTVKVMIDPELVGRSINIRTATNYDNYNKVNIVAKNGDKLYTKDVRNINETVEIQPDTDYLEVVSTAINSLIYDISVDSKPKIISNKVYPRMTIYGYVGGYTDIDISYFVTSVKNYYKIDDGEWLEYPGKAIKLLPNQTIYAKSVDKNGVDSKTEKFEFKPVDYITSDAFDDDRKSSFKTSKTAAKVMIEPELIGKTLEVYMQSSYAYSGNIVQFSFVDANGEILDKVQAISTGYGGEGYVDSKKTIPVGTVAAEVVNLSDTSGHVYELSLDNKPAFIPGNEVNPKIALSGIIPGYVNVTINYFYDELPKLYKIDDGDWKTYTGSAIKVNAGHTIYARQVKDDFVIENKDGYTAVVTNALTSETYDDNLDTYMTYHIGHNGLVGSQGYQYRYIDIDNSIWNKYIDVKWYEWNWNGYTAYLDFVDSNNTVVGDKYSLSGGKTETTKILVPSNATKMRYYTTMVSSAGYDINGKLYEITVNKNPIFNISNLVQPTLTTQGVVDASATVTIDYYYDNVTKLYKIDDGEWQEYKNSPITLGAGQTIYAKGINKNNIFSETVSHKLEVDDNILGYDAYDSDTSTSVGYTTGTSKRLYIDQSMWGKDINVVGSVRGASGSGSEVPKIYFYGDNSNVLKTVSYATGGTNTGFDDVFTVPEGTKYMEFYFVSGFYYLSVKEIYSQGMFNVSRYNPTLTEYGVIDGYNTVTINYKDNASQKLYKINSGEWQEYNSSEIRLEIGDIIYVKSVDSKGNEFGISKYKAITPASKPLPAEAYDGNTSTGKSTTDNTYIVDVGESMRGKEISTTFRYSTIYEILSDNTERTLLTNNDFEKTLTTTLSSNVVSLKISGGHSYSMIYEIRPYWESKINKTLHYPKLTESGVENGYNSITIDYFQTAVQKLYQIVPGGESFSEDNWQNYENTPIRLEAGEKIYAKSIDKNGLATPKVDYTSSLSDGLPSSVYDGSNNSGVSTRYDTYVVEVDESMRGKGITVFSRFSNVYEVLDDKTEKTIISNNGWEATSTATLSSNSVKLKFYGGQSYSMIYELAPTNPVPKSKGKSRSIPQEDNSVIEEPIIKANVPEIEIVPLKLSENKTISINYDDRYTKEYSLDLGNTWLVYNGSITVNSNTTILARSLDDKGNVVASSSFTITSVGIEETTDSLEKDEKVEEQSQEEIVLPNTPIEETDKPKEEGDGNE